MEYYANINALLIFFKILTYIYSVTNLNDIKFLCIMYVPNPSPGPHFFLVPLDKYKGKVPFIITDILNQLENLKSQENQGIFRIQGQQQDITNLCKELDNGHVTDWSKYNSKAVESAFKKYLENLAVFDPLIPENIEKDIESAVEHIEPDNIGKHLHDLISDKYSNLLSHRSTLAAIFHFFSKVIIPNVEKNDMTSSNLSICLSMLFFRRRDVVLSEHLRRSIEILIEKFDTIFDESWYSPPSEFTMTEDEIECLGAPLVSIELAEIELKRRNYRKDSLIPFYTHLTIQPPEREAPKLPD